MKKIKSMIPFLMVIAMTYYFLPSVPITLLAVIPLICLVFSIVYGINNSFNIFYVVFVIVLFVPVILIMPIDVEWILAFGYGIIALIGNAIGMIFYKRNKRIKNMELYGRYLIVAVIGSCIAAVIASTIMMTKMTQITYITSGFGTTVREDVVNFNTNTAYRKYYYFGGEQKEYVEHTIDTAEKLKIKLICSISLFPLWLKNYSDPFVMDGNQYKIIRTYHNSESVIYGSNAYPLSYPFVMTVIENAVK